MSKTKGIFLRDPKSGILWLHSISTDRDFRVPFLGEELDLTTCKQEVHEIITIQGWHLSMASPDFIVAKNENGFYAVLAIYTGCNQFGAIYASITPGFTFKSVYGFAHNGEIYIIGENEQRKWGMVRISRHNSAWLDYCPWTIASQIVLFNCKSMKEVMDKYPITFTLEEFLHEREWPRGMGDLTKEKDEETFCTDEEYHLGTTLEEIKQRRLD